MKRYVTSLLFALCAVATPAFVGCERTVSEEKSVETKSDGTTETKKEKTVETPDGGTKKTSERTVDKP